MIEFGKTLRQAREAKGLTVDDIAKATHMMARQIEALENEDFSGFAAPIYGRGFVKLYCEAVGIEAKPMIAEFMEIFNGNREPSVRLRDESSSGASAPVAAHSEPVRPPAPESAETPTVFVQPTFDSPNPPEPAPPPPPSAERKPSRYAAPTPLDEPVSPANNLFLVIWRPLVLLLAAGFLLWLLFVGVRALYRATRAPARTATAEIAPAARPAQPAAAPKPSSTSDTPAFRRGKIVVDPLYID